MSAGLRIIINFALSADGKISTHSLSPSHFTSKRDLDRLHEIRSRADAILVGRGTLETDQMSLTVPGLPLEQQPRRCVISRKGAFSPDHQLFQTEGGSRHLIINSSAPLPDLPAEIYRGSLVDWLEKLKKEGEVHTLLCEGGGSLVRELFALDLIDEIHLTLASHTLIGGKGAPGLTGLPGSFLPASRNYRISHFQQTIEGETFLSYERQ